MLYIYIYIVTSTSAAPTETLRCSNDLSTASSAHYVDGGTHIRIHIYIYILYYHIYICSNLD